MSSTSGESALGHLVCGCWEDPLAGVDSSLSLFVPLSSCAGVCKIGVVGGSVCGGGVCSCCYSGCCPCGCSCCCSLEGEGFSFTVSSLAPIIPFPLSVPGVAVEGACVAGAVVVAEVASPTGCGRLKGTWMNSVESLWVEQWVLNAAESTSCGGCNFEFDGSEAISR